MTSSPIREALEAAQKEICSRPLATGDDHEHDLWLREKLRVALNLLSSGLIAEAKWQPIETAPKDGTKIDIWFRLSDSHSARWTSCAWDKARERWSGGPTDQGEIHWLATHFMPLPAPPSREAGVTE